MNINEIASIHAGKEEELTFHFPLSIFFSSRWWRIFHQQCCLAAVHKWCRNIEQPMVTQKDDKRWQGGTKGHQKRWWMMKNPRIHGNPSKIGLTGLNWTTFGANGWLMVDWISNGLCYMQLILMLMEINWIFKRIVFGLGMSTDHIINLKFEAPRGRPKNDDKLT